MALLFAATYPERAQALVLYGAAARFMAGPDYPIGFTPEFYDAFADRIGREWGNGWGYSNFIQHASDPEEAARLLAQFERSACTPQMAVEILQRNGEIDVRPILSTITVPTLVMHCVEDPLVPVALGRYLGKQIPHARYVELDGDFHG